MPQLPVLAKGKQGSLIRVSMKSVVVARVETGPLEAFPGRVWAVDGRKLISSDLGLSLPKDGGSRDGHLLFRVVSEEDAIGEHVSPGFWAENSGLTPAFLLHPLQTPLKIFNGTVTLFLGVGVCLGDCGEG